MMIDKIALTLAIIGALNWGGIGLFGFDTVAFFCGGQLSILSRIIYALVGLAGSVVHHVCSSARIRKAATRLTPPKTHKRELIRLRRKELPLFS